MLARYGPYFLYTYSVVLGLGIALALGLTAVLARRGQDGDDRWPGWIDGALAAAAGAILAGRIVFVLLNTAYFAENPFEAWQVWLGGLNYHGALLGGLAGLWLWARLTRRPFYEYAGLFAPGLALLAASGWAACYFEGCAYGLPASPGILTADLPDDFGVFAVRYQTQVFGFLGSLAVFVGAWYGCHRTRPALLLWATLGGLSLVRIIVAPGRGDPAPVLAGLRLDLIVDFVLLAVSLVAWAYLFIAGRFNRARIHPG